MDIDDYTKTKISSLESNWHINFFGRFVIFMHRLFRSAKWVEFENNSVLEFERGTDQGAAAQKFVYNLLKTDRFFSFFCKSLLKSSKTIALDKKRFKILKKGTQDYNIGFVNMDKAIKIFNKIVRKRPLGVTFSEFRVAPHLVGGTCSAMTLDFIHNFLRLLHLQKELDPHYSDLCKTVELVSGKYAHSGHEFRVIQSAFNAIEIKRDEESTDFLRAKMQALCNYFSLSIIDSTKTLYLDRLRTIFDHIEELESIRNLKEGVYLIRMICPSSNHKEEAFGHSMAFIKGEKESYFYDPGEGAKAINKAIEAQEVLLSLQKNQHRWGLSQFRFYRVEKAGDEI